MFLQKAANSSRQIGGALQSARVADTYNQTHSCVLGSNDGETDKICHNRAGKHPGIRGQEAKKGQKRDTGEMTGEQEN